MPVRVKKNTPYCSKRLIIRQLLFECCRLKVKSTKTIFPQLRKGNERRPLPNGKKEMHLKCKEKRLLSFSFSFLLKSVSNKYL